MELTREQAKMLMDLSGQIQDQYGIVIGYSAPMIPMPSTREADFIIFENPDMEAIQCFYKDDIRQQALGPYLVQVIPSEPEFDDEVEGLFKRLEEDLLNGKIWFDPGVSRKVDDFEVEVTRKIFPGGVEVFDTNLTTERYGTVYTYELISAAAQQDKRFKVAKEIIDETWPREKGEEPATREQTPTLQDVMARLLKLLGF
jgi:hypothetical protein